MTPSFDREVVSHRDTPPCAELVSWREAYGLVAGITTRGASQESFKLGPETPEGSTAADPWSRLVSTFSPAFAGVAVSRQPHGTKVREHESGVEGWLRLDGYDGHVTLEAGLLLTVTVADCVPVYLADPGTGGIALLHAGWRGIAAGVLEEGIERLAALTGRPRDCFVMHAGVAIGGTQYEVGPEVVAGLGLPLPPEAQRVDLRDVLAQRAEAAGVRHITVSPWCTYQDADLFHSHRRDGAAAGRMAAYLGRPLT